jgi:hypothetical protein
MEDDTATTTLDFIAPIVVPGHNFREPANEYWALVCLWQGMEYLNGQVRRCEDEAKKAIDGGAKVFSFTDDRFEVENLVMAGRLPDELKNIPMPLVTMAFHWYAISACQFVRLVGAIAKRHDNSRPLPNDYASPIIPEVIAFRDKVAAHFSWSTKNKRDNDAERMASILPSVALAKGRFCVGSMTVSLRRSGKVSTSEAIQEWSLTEVHERLTARYNSPEVNTKAVDESAA